MNSPPGSDSPGAPPVPTPRLKIALAGAFLLLLVTQASIAPLQETDEGRSASICWDMLRTGDWITPRLNSIRYYEKPPLYFWLGAASLAAFGKIDLAVRIPSVLASFLTVCLVAEWGSRVRGARTGLLAGMILATLFLFAFLSRAAMVDPLLTLVITFSLYSADRLLETPRAGLKWSILFGASLGAALLAKGPVGLILPGASLGAYLVWKRDGPGLRRLFHPAGVLALLLVALPWYAAMSLRNPGYLREFLLGQNVDRLVEGSRFNRDRPWWFYLPVLVIGFLPWTLYPGVLLRGVRDAAGDRSGAESRRRIYWASAIAVPFLILSCAHSKLVHYLLPLCPPFALLAADLLGERWSRPSGGATAGRWGAFPFFLLGTLLFGLAGAALVPAGVDPEILSHRLGFEAVGAGHETDLSRIRTYQSPLRGAAGLLAALGLASLGAGWGILRHRPFAALAAWSATLLSGILAAQLLVDPMGPAVSSRRLASKVALRAPGRTPVLLYRRYLRGLSYYLGKPVILWEAIYNEFGHEVGASEAGAVTLGGDLRNLSPFLDRHPDAVIVVESPSRLRELRAVAPKALDEVDHEGEFVIVRPHPSP